MKKIVWTFLLFIINFNFCNADEFSDINKKEADCINKTSSTYQMALCTQKAMTEWENQINNYYRLILNNKLVEKKFVEQSQKEWLEYKISNYKMINQLEKMQGTMYLNIASGFKREVLKNRAIELRAYYLTIIE